MLLDMWQRFDRDLGIDERWCAMAAMKRSNADWLKLTLEISNL
jgi:hypothetical protein